MPDPYVDLSRYDQSWYDRGRSAVVIVLWEIVQSVLIHGSLHPMYGWRRFWFRRFGAKIGTGTLIRRTVICNYPWKLAIGDHCWIGDQVNLYALERIEIGNHVVISQQSYLCTGTHDHWDPHFGLIVKPIIIQDYAWVALGSLVMPGVTIGTGALLGARTVLTKDAREWTVYLGHPARAAGQRDMRAI